MNTFNSDELKFSSLIKDMEIPIMRREVNQTNLRWFLRNGAIYNRNHKNFEQAVRLAQQLVEI
jgi:hypothetical protein